MSAPNFSGKAIIHPFAKIKEPHPFLIFLIWYAAHLFLPNRTRFVANGIAIPKQENIVFNPKNLKAVNSNRLTKIIIAIIFFCWMMWLGYRLRQQEDAVRENDAKADAYFDSINKASHK